MIKGLFGSSCRCPSCSYSCFFIVESDESLWARFVGAIFKALKIFLIILLAVAIKKWAISSSGGSGVDYDCQPAIGGQMICQPKY